MSEVIGTIPESDDLDWAKEAKRHADWLRDVAPRHGFDVQRVILGDVLLTITGDDQNCFGVSGAPFVPGNATIGKEQLLIRLNWEIGTPELPRQIKRRLGKVKKRLERIDWQTEEGFKKAKELWTGEVKDFTQTEIEKHPKYDNAMKWVHSLEEANILPSSS